MAPERDALAAQIDKLGALTKICDDAQIRLYNNMMALDKKDPRLTAALRRYGIFDDLSAFFKALGDMTSQIAPLLRMVNEATKT